MPLMLTRLLRFAGLGVCVLLLNEWLVSDWLQKASNREVPISISGERIQAEVELWHSRMGRQPSTDEIAEIVKTEADEEVLFREALKAGLHKTDPVVIGRLVRNMQFCSG